MVTKILLPLLALAGVVFAVYTVKAGSKEVVPAEPVAQPASGPFVSYVAGAGIVEASTRNIAVGAVVPGVVTKVVVKVGDSVKTGDPLFVVDDRAAAATVAVLQAQAESARQTVVELESRPRPEDVPPAEAKVAEARANLEDKQADFQQYERISKTGAVSDDELRRRRYAVDVVKAQVAEAEATLAQLRAGTYKPVLDTARAEVAAAESRVRQAEVDLDRLTMRSPVDGEVLQVDVRAGEYAASGPSQPLMLIGDVDVMHVRVDVDENDAWRVVPGASAVAFLRGNSDLKTDLRFVYVEPYVIPKRSLTGESSERVDTRVLQVIYAFDRTKELPVYVGQQMDVFIEAPPVQGATERPATTRPAA